MSKHQTYFVVSGSTAVLVHNVDPYDISFTQDSVGEKFSDGPWKGRTLDEAVEEARRLGKLPPGLQINAVRYADGTWVTTNNRTLLVAQRANLRQVAPVEMGKRGPAKVQQLLRDADLPGPVARQPRVRCP